MSELIINQSSLAYNEDECLLIVRLADTSKERNNELYTTFVSSNGCLSISNSNKSVISELKKRQQAILMLTDTKGAPLDFTSFAFNEVIEK